MMMMKVLMRTLLQSKSYLHLTVLPSYMPYPTPATPICLFLIPRYKYLPIPPTATSNAQHNSMVTQERFPFKSAPGIPHTRQENLTCESRCS